MVKKFFVVLSILLGIAATAAAQEQVFQVTATRGAVIRAEPSTSSARLTVVAKETILTVVAVNGDWVKVRLSEVPLKEGYIYKTLGFVKSAADIAPVPAPTPVEPKPVPVPRTEPVPASEQPTPTPKRPVAPVLPVAAPVQGRGQFGLGGQVAFTGGIAPSVLYDLKSYPATIRGMADFGTGYSAFGVQGLYRFKTNPDPNASVTIEPYVGGGLTFVNIDFGILGSQSFRGFLGSGGVFFTFRALPNVRWSAEINLPVYNTGTFGPAVYGTYLGLGGHYFFPKGK